MELSMNMEQVLNKNFFFNIKLDSDSSRTSEGDTESVLSLQGKETDIAQDTPDTDTKSEYSSDEDVFEVEYEVASLSGDNNPLEEDTSSGSEDMLVGAAIAAAICDASMEAWITDGEDSDTSLEEIGLGQTDFLTCIQCKSRNDNPRFSYCDKCFQRCWQCKMPKNFSGFPLCCTCYKAKKTLFPPRPRRVRPRNKKVVGSQDSGLGSSQELVSKHLAAINNRKRTVSDGSDSLFSDTEQETNNRKRARIDESGRGTKRCLDDDNTSLEPSKKAKVGSSNPENLINDKRNVPSLIVVNNECGPSSSGLRTNKTDLATVAHTESVSNFQGTSSNSNCVSGAKLTNIEDKGAKTNETLPMKDEKPSYTLSEPKELCIVCNSQPKNSIFLHGKTGHMCCCYRCAVRTWHACKSCPICKMKVQNVVKVFVCS